MLRRMMAFYHRTGTHFCIPTGYKRWRLIQGSTMTLKNHTRWAIASVTAPVRLCWRLERRNDRGRSTRAIRPRLVSSHYEIRNTDSK